MLVLVIGCGIVAPGVLGRASGSTTAGSTDRSVQAVQLTRIGSFTEPLHLTWVPGSPRDLVVVQRAGLITRLQDGRQRGTTFLDIRDRVYSTAHPEMGLLSVAFSPGYPSTGAAYVAYTSRTGRGDLRISAFTPHVDKPSSLDPASERTVLEIEKPWYSHSAGMLQFGADGLLYVSVGDGDGSGRTTPGAFAQSRNELLGNILRIDIRQHPYSVPSDNPYTRLKGVRPEIWAYGLRNPWRFWIDRPTGRMFIGDVGLDAREEIDVLAPGARGRNFGWPCFEGTRRYSSTSRCPGWVPPIWEASHAQGACSVIVGPVVRDARLPSLRGTLLHGDFCDPRLRALTLKGSRAISDRLIGARLSGLVSFGSDWIGRVYAISVTQGVYRIDPARSRR